MHCCSLYLYAVRFSWSWTFIMQHIILFCRDYWVEFSSTLLTIVAGVPHTYFSYQKKYTIRPVSRKSHLICICQLLTHSNKYWQLLLFHLLLYLIGYITYIFIPSISLSSKTFLIIESFSIFHEGKWFNVYLFASPRDSLDLYHLIFLEWPGILIYLNLLHILWWLLSKIEEPFLSQI